MNIHNMIPKEFVAAFFPFAKQTEEKTGISAIAILAQAALESGWGKAAPGNMFFGVKDTDGINGNEQLLTTTEYSRRMDLKFPEVISVTPVIKNGEKYYKYIVKDYFRKYDTPEQCFTDYTSFVKTKIFKKHLLLFIGLQTCYISFCSCCDNQNFCLFIFYSFNELLCKFIPFGS